MTKKVTAPPAAQTRKKPEIRSEEILRAAADIFVNEGYAAFNLRRVAAAVGVRLGALQYYFPTRQQLLATTLERVLSQFMAEFEAVAGDQSVPPMHRLRKLCELDLQYFSNKDTGSVLVSVFSLQHNEAFGAEDALVKATLDKHFTRFKILFENVLKELAPRCSKNRIRSIVVLLTSQLDGLMLFVRRNHPRAFTRELVNAQLTQLSDMCVGLAHDDHPTPRL